MNHSAIIKFVISNKTTKICQIFSIFCGLLRKKNFTWHGQGNQMVQISISRVGKFQSTEANIVQGFIVNAIGFISVFHLKNQYIQTCTAKEKNMAFIQKVLKRLSYLLTDEPYYFPDLEILKISHFKGLKSYHIRNLKLVWRLK